MCNVRPWPDEHAAEEPRNDKHLNDLLPEVIDEGYFLIRPVEVQVEARILPDIVQALRMIEVDGRDGFGWKSGRER